jgi:hypothetical protein
VTAAQMPYSRSLAELRRDDEARFGGKSAGLGELLAAGIPVPGGFALSTAAFHEFLEQSGLATEIGRRLASLSIDDVSSVAGACDAIATAIGAAPIPAGVEAQIGGGCTELARAIPRRPSRFARARLARTATLPRSPVSRRRSCGSVAPRKLPVPCAIVGRAYTAQPPSATARGCPPVGRHPRWAWRCS